MSQREDALKFETGRIKALQEERLHIQKKTFTKWMNSFLVKARMEVEDLFTDLADGKKLLKLLEIISGEKLGKPNNGRMRVHKIENVNKSLAFLHTKVRLESIGAEDIVDGNPRLILGLIWTIILRFQIQEIEIDVDEENESSEKKSAKDALLLWCQRKTNGYQNVNIQDFTGSWRSGLGFNALIHAHRPDLIDFNNLVPTKHIDNLNNAFDTAERSLGIPRLLDAEDIDTAKPDEKSVLTYVASYYHTFAQMYNKDKSGRRIANIISQIKEADDLKYKYELDGKSLLTWIRATIVKLNSRDFPNNLEGVQKLLLTFNDHITVQKPPKYNEKNEIEANYFIINTRLKELNQHSYVPPEGLLVHDIERAWEELEKSEYLRELALREEVIRQTNLEQLAIRFEKKSLLREGYLKDMIQVLSDPRYGINLAQVEATLKKHEAISADILAREQRCEQLVTMAEYLVKENYHDCNRVKARADEITRTWEELIQLLDNHKVNLERFSNLMQLVRDVDTITASIHELEETLVSEDVGVHLIGVEDLLQNHSLVESQISSIGDTIKRIGKTASGFTGKELSMLDGKIKTMNEQYEKMIRVCKERRCKLEDSRAYYLFVQDCEEEESWVNEKLIVCGGNVNCKDLRGVISLIGGHKMLLDEVKARRGKIVCMVERGNELVRVWEKEGGGNKSAECSDVNQRIKSLEGKWAELKDSADRRSSRLEVVLEAFQFYSDANEMDSWVTEKRPLVSSSDYGSDEPSAQALLQRHLNLEEEIIAYEVDVKGLNSQADKLVTAGINSIVELSETTTTASSNGTKHQEQDEYVTEQKLVPQEYWEDEVVEKTDYRTVTEERAVAQVKALYAFQGQEIEIKKGEVMFLLNKTNSDWWNVRKANGEDGFVPANYVKEIEPKVVMVQVRKPEVIKETKRVKKTRMVLQAVQKPIQKPVKKSQSAQSLKQQQQPNSGPLQTEPVLTRTQRINTDYSQIKKLSILRKQNLQESIKLFQFLRECDDFEKWITEKKKYLGTPEPNVQAAKRAFEKFLTDLTASSSRISEIDNLVKQFDDGKTNAATNEKVHNRADHVKQLYNELLALKAGKEKTLEGALSVELFNRTCEEVNDWMSEKMMQIDTDEWSNDLKTVQALQRKHTNLERELAPINEKVQRVNLLAESVKKTYPLEEQNVEEKKHEVVKKWDHLVMKANERKHALEHAVGFQIFDQGVKSLMNWATDSRARMNAYVRARDVSTAEEALKVHSELGDEIKSKDSEFDEFLMLGSKIQHVGNEVGEKMEGLKRERNIVAEEYAEKTDWLNQVLDLQVFLREADHIDSCTRNHVQFVQSTDVGGNLDEVESLIKRHGDFENTLVAQDERLKVFDSMGSKLIEAGHFEQQLIEERRDSVINRKGEVKQLAKTRKNELHRSLKYHEFNNDVEETLAWVNEKIQVAEDDSYKDLTNVDKKLKKHEAFAGELRANEVRIKNINRAGEKLVQVVPEKTPEIQGSVSKLNQLWDQLVVLSSEKYDKLRQAEAQASFNKNLDSVVDRLGGIQSNLKNGSQYGDRRSCKDAVKRANSLGAELVQLDSKVKELEKLADEMEKEQHFDSGSIRGRVEEARGTLDQLVVPVDQLKSQLGNAWEYYSFLHELDAETSWINEKQALVDHEYLIQDLHQAQTSVKKHKKLEQEVLNREPVVVKLVEKGNAKFNHHQNDVRERIREFEQVWGNLKQACGSKSKKLDLSLKSQQFFFDAGEIEAWMNEKEVALGSKEVGKDIHSSRVLLTKHKGIELEMDSYGGLITEMKCMANQMVQSGHPDKLLINAKINGVDEHMGLLRRMGNERREKLIRRVGVLEYFSEVDEFLQYVDEVFGREVGSNEYGVDYEHLNVLKGRFREVELKVDGVNERFRGLEQLGQRLSQGDTVEEDSEGRSVDGTALLLRDKWNNMLALMAAREQKLHAAGEIHAFNRDVADSLARINEKLNSIPDTVGRDVNSCDGMLRLHEAFENDLLALEAQLQVLVDDASRLQSLYPTNAQNIREEQSLVIESWNNLQSRATLRKEQLQNAVDFWRFSAEYASCTSFINSLLTTLPSQPKVRDTASSQGLMNEHERIRSEIDTREDQFERVFNLGGAMVEEQHPESAEVARMIGNLKHLKEKLLVAWEHKKIYLDQLIDLNIFLRDAKQLETVCTTQEVSIGNLELGDDVESVDKSLKKHEAFEKLVQTQDEKFTLLEVQGMKLVRQHHFDSPTVQSRLVDVKKLREKVKAACCTKRDALENRSKYVRFLRDVLETTAWVDEKIKKLRLDESVNRELNLNEKIKKLKKHQGFSAEVSSNTKRVEDLFRIGGELKAQGELDELKLRWGELVKLVGEFGKGLEEAQDILEFTNQCELTDAWVREKESLVNAGDVGEDYEHCCEIIKRVDDFDSEVKVDDERIKGLNSLANKLIQRGGGDHHHGGSSDVVSSVIQGLNHRWGNLKVGLEGYRRKLERALDVHKFNRDAEEVEERIKSVRGLISGDVGRDLEHCEGLVRKHDGVEVQVNAVGERVKELDNERNGLIGKGVEEAKLKRIDDAWLDVSEACFQRTNALTSSLHYHKFLKKFNDLKRYIDITITRVQNSNLGGNVPESEESVKSHKELIDNVQAREALYQDLVRVGRRFVVEKHEYSTEFTERVQEIEELWSRLNSTLQQMSGKLDQSLKMQRLFAKISEVEVEIECNDAFLNGRELGESLGAVLVLLRRHEEFTNAFGSIEANVKELIQLGDQLTPGHFDSQAITSRLNELKCKLDHLKGKAQSRSIVLHDSYELHKFVLEIHEIETYALEKLKIALDDNYTDHLNLQSKIQRHAAFESEVQANYDRVNSLMLKSECLLKQDSSSPLHSFMVEIQRKLDNITSVWKELQAASSLKRERLQESYQALLFNQNLEDIEGWMDELEQQLESEDHGVDLESVRALINKWMHLESEFLHKSEVISGVCKTAEAFLKANHYLAEDIHSRVEGIRARYDSLSEPLHIRRENLDETNKFFEFLRDVGEEREWVDEKIPSVGVDAELGANLTQVQSLQKKHNQLESEIISHEPLVGLLVTRSTGMVRSGHFASDQIQTVTRSLQEKFQELKDGAAVRRLRLADSMLSQTFYDEANELLGWMTEKSNYVRNVECKDCENVSGLLKRLDGFQRDLTGFHLRIDKVLGTGEELVSRGHFDSERIQAKKQEVSHEYSELQKTSDKKRLRVSDAMKFYEFNKVCNECVDWINEMMNIAGSEEYGRDVEHVEVLIQKFEGFYGNVQESRVHVVGQLADGLVEEGYPDVERVKKRAAEVTGMWEEFKELAQARLEALQGAKQVHAFDRTADETISWINEKHNVVMSEEYGHDLESIQCLIRRHTAFENDLKPVEHKVTEVNNEAARLRSLFVDASDHINVKLNACEEAWRELVERTKTRGDKLNQAENLQAYFDDYTNLMAFVNELVAKVTSGELGRTVRAAEASLGKNEAWLKEIGAFKGVDEFCRRGEQLVRDGHFMGDEINEKIKSLRGRWEYLQRVGTSRNELFRKNLDLRVFLVQVDEFDKWMGNREPELREYNLGESIREVEELIREHEEFTHTLEAQESKLEGLRRKTLIEDAWEMLKKQEEMEREEQAKKQERERIEGLKRREVERITGEIITTRKEEKEGSGVRGGFLGGSRFGSLVFGGGRRGSEPAPVVSPESNNYSPEHSNCNNSKTASPFKKISLTPPTSLEHIACSQQQQQQQQPDAPLLSRSESLRLLNTSTHDMHSADTLKKPKRTPSFTTRRRTASFRRKKNAESLPPVEIDGYLERKHELQAGGKRAAVRSWKHYYVLLCGQLLCFFKDQEDFELSKVGSTTPISIHKCVCTVAVDYTKRKYVFRVKPTDGSEFLFAAESSDAMENWVRKINFHAMLEPKDQLIPEQEQSRVSMPPPPPPPKTKHYDSTSTDDDDINEPVPARKPKSRSLQQPRSREPIYAEDAPLDPHQPAVRTNSSKPPIPPRSSSIILNEQNGGTTSGLAGPRSPVKNGTDTVDNQQYFVPPPHPNSRPVSVDRIVQQYNSSMHHHHQPPPAPLPRSINTFKPVNPTTNNNRYYFQQQQYHHVGPQTLYRNAAADYYPTDPSSLYRGPVSPPPKSPTSSSQQQLSPRSSGSLPPGLSLQSSPPYHHHDPHNNSSSENEQGTSVHSSSPSPHAAEQDPNKKKKEGGLMGLFRRKKATQL